MRIFGPFSRPRFPVVLLALAALAAPVSGWALSPVSIRVTQLDQSPKAGQGKKKGKEGPVEEKTVKQLKIELRNTGGAPYTGVEVRYWFFGFKKGNSESAVVAKGTKSADIPAGGTAQVESDRATAVFSKGGYTEATDKKTGEKTRTRVERGGDRLTGYGVKVVSGEEVLAEYYSSPTFKAVTEADQQP